MEIAWKAQCRQPDSAACRARLPDIGQHDGLRKQGNSMDLHLWNAQYSLVGLLVGFLVGLTGMGGGSLMTPILILILHTKPSVAVGADLTYSAITKWIGSIQHGRQKSINYWLASRLAIGSVPGSLLGVWYLQHLLKHNPEQTQGLIVRLLGGMLVLVAASLLLKAQLRTSARVKQWVQTVQVLGGTPETDRKRVALAVFFGFILGFLVGLTSVGSGTLFGVLMLVVFGVSMKRLAGTDVFQAALLTTAAALGNVYAHNVDYTLVANLLVGSIPGVLLGSRLSNIVPEKCSARCWRPCCCYRAGR